MSSFLYIPAGTRDPPSLEGQQAGDAEEASSIPPRGGASSSADDDPVFKDQVRSIPLANATPVEETAAVASGNNVDVSQRRRLLELEERRLRLDRERFEFEQQQKLKQQQQSLAVQQEDGKKLAPLNQIPKAAPQPTQQRQSASSPAVTNENEPQRSSGNNGCCKLSAQLESIFRWAIFGLTCLSWLFVVSSTATCSFISDSSRTNVDYGLFCFNIASQKGRYQGADLPGALVAARLFATVACLIMSAALIAVTLVIFLLPKVHAVRAWWTARILFCVALFCVFLTFAMNGDSLCDGTCSPSAGSVLNSFNVIILIALITLSFLIMVPKKPLLNVFETDTRPSAPAPSIETPANLDHYDDDKPIVVTPAPDASATTTRTEGVTAEGHHIVRETIAYPDGRQEVTETIEEPSTIVQRGDRTFVSMQEAVTNDGNRMVVETTKHSDGRQEIVEVMEEPSIIEATVEDATQPFDEESPEPINIASTQSRDPSVIGEHPVVPKKKVVAERDTEAPTRRRQLDPPEN